MEGKDGSKKNIQNRLPATWTAPGNILIAGEYRLTERGGLGMALAAGGRARLDIDKAHRNSCTGRWARRNKSYFVHQGKENCLPTQVWALLKEEKERESSEPTQIIIDTNLFFDKQGRKRGFGSSAVAALLYAKGFARHFPTPRIAALACRAHQNFQGGRGSGYDIFCSAYGGTGIFCAEGPQIWQPVIWPKNLLGWILRGPAPVKSKDAVRSFCDWGKNNLQERIDYGKENDALIAEIATLLSHEICQESSLLDFLQLLKELRTISATLGEKIGIPSTVLPFWGLEKSFFSDTQRGFVLKCLGAGNEMALLLALPGALRKHEQTRVNKLVARGDAEILIPEYAGLQKEP